MPLQLPFESRSLREQKDLLGFEDVAESFITPQERKDAKRSDPGAGHTVNQLTGRRNATAKAAAAAAAKSQNAKEASYLDDDEEALAIVEEKQQSSLRNVQEARQTANADAIQEDNEQSGSQKRDNLKKYSTTYSQQTQARQAEQSKKVSSITTMTTTTTTGGDSGGDKAQKARQTFDKTLLIPQERYKSSLPKIIITASASVSANGKKLNYSLGNVLGQGAELKIPPPTYDDYKEEDVVLDPFFQDVPKIKKH